MLLLVGLGNPGPRYAGHRHNVGFMAADEIVRRRVFSPWRARFNGEVAEGHLGGERTLILKPMTFMNELSKAVGEAVRFLKIPLDRVVVFHDELDLAPGRIRMKKGGGAGGHNGLRDIDAHVGNGYRRVRIGIGHPGHKDLVLHWVLRDFEPDERDPKDGWLPKALGALADESALLAEGTGKADERYMSRVAHLAPPPGPAQRTSGRRVESVEDGFQLRNRRPAQCRQVDPVQCADRHAGGAGGQLSVLHHRAQCRPRRRARSAARQAGDDRELGQDHQRPSSSSSTSPAWSRARRRAKGWATSSSPTSARSMPSPTCCAASRMAT